MSDYRRPIECLRVDLGGDPKIDRFTIRTLTGVTNVTDVSFSLQEQFCENI